MNAISSTPVAPNPGVADAGSTRPLGSRTTYRSVFISDTHLGTRGARCDFLADFLRSMDCAQLYLVGDIVDGWRLRKSWYWMRRMMKCCG